MKSGHQRCGVGLGIGLILTTGLGSSCYSVGPARGSVDRAIPVIPLGLQEASSRVNYIRCSDGFREVLVDVRGLDFQGPVANSSASTLVRPAMGVALFTPEAGAEGKAMHCAYYSVRPAPLALRRIGA